MSSSSRAISTSRQGFTLFVTIKFALCFTLMATCDLYNINEPMRAVANIFISAIVCLTVFSVYFKARKNDHSSIRLSLLTLPFLLDVMRKIFDEHFRLTGDPYIVSVATTLLFVLIMAEIVNIFIVFKKI